MLSELGGYAGTVAVFSGVVTVAIYIGSLSSRFVNRKDYEEYKQRLSDQIKTDRHACKNECHGKLLDLESKLIERNKELDNRYNDKTELLFKKFDQLYTLMGNGFEEIRLDIVKLQTSMLAWEKRFEKGDK